MKTVILDFDGTLADTQRIIIETTRVTLDKMGLPQANAEDIRKTIGLPLRENFIRAAHISDPALVDRAVEVYRENFNDIALREIRLFEGVEDTLREWHRRGIVLTIASSRFTKSLRELTAHLGIADVITLMCGEETVVHKKPAPDLALLILEQTGTRPDEALVVGDASFDILMGRGAGCRTCGVTYGNQSREELLAAGADYVIDHFADALAINF